MRISLTGVPFAGGQSHYGVALAPTVLRDEGLLSRLERIAGAVVRDHGDLRGLSTLKADVQQAIEENRFIAESLAHNAHGSDLSIQLGGDHGIGLGTIASTLSRFPDAGVIWVDAHGDINSPESSPTGNFHGMPLALAIGAVDESHRNLVNWMQDSLDPSRLVIVGARSLDPGEIGIIRRCGVRVYDAVEIRRSGIHSVMSRTLHHLFQNGRRPLHLSFDVDVLDPEVAPSTGTPVREGLTRDEGMELCSMIGDTGMLVSMDMVEFNPMIASSCSYATAQVTIDLIAAVASRCVRPGMPLEFYRNDENQWLRDSQISCLG